MAQGLATRARATRTARGTRGPAQLAQSDQRLDRVRPDGCVGSFSPPRAAVRTVAQVAARRLQVAERELEAAEHAEAEDDVDLVRAPRASGSAFLGRRPRVSTRPRSASTSALTLPTQTRVVLASARASSYAAAAWSSANCQRPRPLDQRSATRGSTPAALVAPRRPRLQLLEHARGRSGSPRTSGCRASAQRGCRSSRAEPRRSSIATPRSSRPGVISAAYSRPSQPRDRRRRAGRGRRRARPSRAPRGHRRAPPATSAPRKWHQRR